MQHLQLRFGACRCRKLISKHAGHYLFCVFSVFIYLSFHERDTLLPPPRQKNTNKTIQNETISTEPKTEIRGIVACFAPKLALDWKLIELETKLNPRLNPSSVPSLYRFYFCSLFGAYICEWVFWFSVFIYSFFWLVAGVRAINQSVGHFPKQSIMIFNLWKVYLFSVKILAKNLLCFARLSSILGLQLEEIPKW